MVSALAFNRIFSTPFSTKPFSFRSLASGAISLVAIFSVKLVAIFTVGTKRVLRSDRVRIGQAVLARCNHPQMGNRNTMTVFANMVYDHTFRYFTDTKVISHSMSATPFSAKEERTIAVFIERSNPEFTLSILLPFTVKSFEFLSSVLFHMPIVPCMPFVKQGVKYV